MLGLEEERECGADRLARAQRPRPLPGRARRRRRGRAPRASTSEALAAAGGEEEAHEEELFGPAEGLHATYRTLREEVLEASWKAGRELSEPRLDTAVDVNRAIARYLELLKLAALAQRPGDEATAEAIEAVNGLLRQVATPEQQAELDASPLDAYLLDSERERDGRRELIAARHEPSLEAFLPRRGDGALSLSASDLDLYLTCPLKYKFARVFGIPQEPTINQRFGILIHNVLERFHKERAARTARTGCERLMDLFEAGWRRTGFGTSDDELQFRDRAREAMRLYWERERRVRGRAGLAGAQVRLQDRRRTTCAAASTASTACPTASYELIDYKTGERKSEAELESDLQLALYRLAAREAWEHRGRHRQLLLRARRRQGRGADQARRRRAGRAHRARRSARASSARTSSRAPRPRVCSWCDYRLICPAAES